MSTVFVIRFTTGTSLACCLLTYCSSCMFTASNDSIAADTVALSAGFSHMYIYYMYVYIHVVSSDWSRRRLRSDGYFRSTFCLTWIARTKPSNSQQYNSKAYTFVQRCSQRHAMWCPRRHFSDALFAYEQDVTSATSFERFSFSHSLGSTVCQSICQSVFPVHN